MFPSTYPKIFSKYSLWFIHKIICYIDHGEIISSSVVKNWEGEPMIILIKPLPQQQVAVCTSAATVATDYIKNS